MKTPLRVLIAEDNPADAELVLRELRKAGFEPEWQRVDTETGYLAHLHADLDVVLSDYSMPQFNGLRALELLKESGFDVPFIVISGTIGEDLAVQVMQNGATDYLLKDRLARLGTAVTQAMSECGSRRERKAAETAFRRSESRFQVLFEQSAVGMCLVSMEGTFLRTNQRFCEIVGYSSEELLERDCIATTHLEDRAHEEISVARIASGEIKTDSWDKRYLRKDGSTVWCHLTLSLLPAGDGKPAQFAGVIEDITERRRAESRFRRLVDSNAQGVFFWDTKGRITSANDAFLKLVGYTREELNEAKLNWTAMTPPEFVEADERAVTQLAETGVCTPIEKEFFRKDGKRVPILLGAALFEDNREEGLAFTVDLTERKKLEQQFLRAQRMESIGTLAGGIAHDLNNVLGPIMMSIALLKMRFPDPASQELISIIGTSAERGADMVRQVLSFARGMEGRRMEVQVKHLIQDIEKIIRDTFSKDIQLRSIIPHDLWTIQGDPTQIHQVLLNLCVNARDAMPNGGVLTLCAENRVLDETYAALENGASPGAHVYLQVEDTGTGMPEEIIDKIFEPFFTTKGIGKGTGLGLSTSVAIVKSHGGFMRVYSEPGKGTRFKVYLPAQTEASAEMLEEIAAEMPRGHGELILVVDDEASVRQITQQTLEAFGYRVVVASNGGEAVTVFAQRQR